MQERTIIDGQQRLTTLQLLLHALHAQLVAVGADQPGLRVELARAVLGYSDATPASTLAAVRVQRAADQSRTS